LRPDHPCAYALRYRLITLIVRRETSQPMRDLNWLYELRSTSFTGEATMRKIELYIETIIFQSRWILAPFYLGLALSLVLMLVQFCKEFYDFLSKISRAHESDVILGVLGLIDLTFTANLVVIVIFSGYENFVSKIETTDHDRPEWMTKVDFGGLKQKLMTSIVAISAIQVLRAFMNIEQQPDNTRLAWLVGIHVVFVMSMLIVVLSDRLSAPNEHPSEGGAKKSAR
jgi:uncharacterized protein (TIGR00645 family)